MMVKHSRPLWAHSFLSVVIHSLLFHSGQLYADSIETESTSASEAYTFDPHLFKGTGLNQELIERFNHSSQLQAGQYTLDVYVNKRFIDRQQIKLVDGSEQANTIDACWTTSLLERAGILGSPDFQKTRAEATHQILVKL